MEHWVLGQASAPPTVEHSASLRLIEAIGAPDSRTFAGSVLAVARSHSRVRHCAIFAFEKHRNPDLVSAESLAGASVAQNAAVPYARDFFRKDEIQNVIVRRAAQAPNGNVVVLRQSDKEIADPDYRSACYSGINIGERIAGLIRLRHDAWLAVNLYRDTADGSFPAEEAERLRNLFLLFSHAAARHYAIDKTARAKSIELDGDELCPDGVKLTRREREVALRILDGRTTKEIAAELKIGASSVITYRERAYIKIGVTCRAELFAFVLRRRAA